MSTSTYEIIKLGDPAIIEIVRLLQMAMLTGTDITDNLRTLSLVIEDGIAYPDPAFIEAFENNIKKLEKEADQLRVELA
jgi:protein-tyrosine phosphatase